MAKSEKVTSKEVIQDKLFDGAKKSADDFSEALDKIEERFKGIIDEQTKFLQLNKANPKQLEDIKKLNEAIKKSKEAREALNATEKIRVAQAKEAEKLEQERQKTAQQRIKTAKEEETLRQKKIKGIKDEEKALKSKEQEEQKAAQQNIKNTKAEAAEKEKQAKMAAKLEQEQAKLNSEYTKASKKLDDMKRRVKDLLASEKELSKADLQLISATQELDKKLKQIDTTLGDGKRFVGLYRQEVREAIHDTGLFNNVIGDSVQAFKRLRAAEKDTEKGTEAFSNVVKAGAVAGLIVLIGLAKKLVDGFSEVSQKVQDVKFAFDRLTSGTAGTNDITKFLRVLNETRPQLRGLSADLQKLANDEKDLQDAAADQTVGISQRNEALDKSVELQIKKAKIEKEVAAAELRQIQAEVDLAASRIDRQSVVNDLLVKEQEAKNKLSAAQSDIDSAEVEGARRKRQALQDEVLFNVDLTRSNKLNANARQKVLEDQLADEKNQLEQRKKFAKELNDLNRAAISDQVKELKRLGVSVQLFNELVKQGDEVQAKNIIKRKAANIEGTETEVALLKVVKQAQENKIRNNELIKKQEEEEIKRRQKILEIEKEIEIIRQEDAVTRAQANSDKTTELSDQTNDKILQREDVFNRKKLLKRKEFADNSLKFQQQLIDEQEELLKLQRDKDLKAIDDNIKDEKIKAAEKLKINEKYQLDLAQLDAEQRANQIAFEKKELEELKKRELRRTEIVVEKLQSVTSALQTEVDKQNQKREDGIDKEISDREKAIDRQSRLAEEGKENQLAFEIAALEKAELEKKEIEERAQRQQEAIQLADAYFNALNARLKEPGANPNNAAYLALGDVLLARGVAKGLAGLFFEGTENVAEDLKGNKVHNGRDGYVIGVDGSERILTGEQNKMIGSMSNEDLANLAQSYQTGLLDTSGTTESDVMNAKLLSEISEKLTALNNKPVQIWELDKFQQLVEKRISGNYTEKITHVPPPRNFRFR